MRARSGRPGSGACSITPWPRTSSTSARAAEMAGVTVEELEKEIGEIFILTIEAEGKGGR